MIPVAAAEETSAVSVMLVPVVVVEAFDFSVVVVVVKVLELLVMLPDPQPVDRNIKTASAPIATTRNAGDRFISEHLMI
jgi:hypothetical protein